jgi:hypothetical protein
VEKSNFRGLSYIIRMGKSVSRGLLYKKMVKAQWMGLGLTAHSGLEHIGYEKEKGRLH